MAGFNKSQEDTRPTTEERWVRAAWLVENNVDFCLLSAEQDHFRPDGTPQMTYVINYAYNGQFCVRELNLDVGGHGWREKEAGRMAQAMHEDGKGGLRKGFPFHHLRLCRKPFKQGTVLYFDDVPGKEEVDRCACDGEGVIDPANPDTWTEHYKLTLALNAALNERGQEDMDTSQMTEEAIRVMLKVMGVQAA